MEVFRMNMKKKVISLILVLIMALSMVMAGCSSPQGGTSGGPGQKATPATLQIGVENKGYGDQFVQASLRW